MSVLDAVRAQPAKSPGGGRAVMFVAARRGEGVSTAVHSSAMAQDGATTYAIDLDVRRNALVRLFAESGPPLGPRIDARLNGSLFYQLADAQGRALPDPRPAVGFHRVGRARTYVSALDASALPEGGRVLIAPDADYWNAARAGGATVIVDAPALERSQIGLRIAAHMDGVVLVVGDGAGAAAAAVSAKSAILAAGGDLIGLVYARASAPVLALERFWRQAG